MNYIQRNISRFEMFCESLTCLTVPLVGMLCCIKSKKAQEQSYTNTLAAEERAYLKRSFYNISRSISLTLLLVNNLLARIYHHFIFHSNVFFPDLMERLHSFLYLHVLIYPDFGTLFSVLQLIFISIYCSSGVYI